MYFFFGRGLLSSHVFAELLRERKDARLRWYRGQLLELAEDMGRRLLPAFNTTTGIPHARVSVFLKDATKDFQSLLQLFQFDFRFRSICVMA